jgi:hypothetical protein
MFPTMKSNPIQSEMDYRGNPNDCPFSYLELKPRAAMGRQAAPSLIRGTIFWVNR